MKGTMYLLIFLGCFVARINEYSRIRWEESSGFIYMFVV